MKKILLHVIILITFYSYSQNRDSAKIIEMRHSPVITYNCFNDIEKAKIDFLKNDITYFYTDFGKNNNRYAYELEQELKKENIKFVHYIIEDEFEIKGSYITKSKNCYAEYMNYLINIKFGVNFIQNLKQKSDSMFILKNKDKVFDFNDFNDVVRYNKSKKSSEQFTDIENDFIKLVKYPKGYKYNEKKDESYSYSSIDFIIHKTGKIDIESISTVMKYQENNKYIEHFEKQLVDFVKKSKWNPVSVYGITLSSRMSFGFHYD